MIRPADWVRLTTISPDVASQDEKTRAFFAFCLGRVYPAAETYLVPDIGIVLHVLDVHVEIDDRFGGFMYDIRVEDEYLEVVSPPEPGHGDAR